MQELRDAPGAAHDLQFFNTAKSTQGRAAGLLRPLRALVALSTRFAAGPSCAMAFSSAHASFWEKGAWLMLARTYRVPMVVMLVDGNFPRFYTSLPSPLRGLVRWLLARYAVVVAQTASWRRYFENIAPGAHYIVLSNGVDCRAFAPVDRPVRARPIVTYLGWLIPEKGVFDLIEAARLLQDRGLDFTVRLIGPPHGNEERVRQAIADGRLSAVVEVPGIRRSRAEVQAAYNEADVFVLPSWAEGLPNALLEAMASGLPVVATAVGGMTDVIEHGVSGSLVPPRNAAAIAAALEPLVRDPGLRARMGRSARLRVETAFNNDDFLAALRRLLAAGGDPAVMSR